MLRDVFYYGKKPNAHPREKFAESFEDAKQQTTTEHFWIINEFYDYTNLDWDFDFDFLPDEDVWASEHINIWPSNYYQDSGTWLCSKHCSDIKVYRTDVTPLKRIPTDSWVLLDKVDRTKFDFSWHPDPMDPPYIYRWGCKYYPVEVQHVLEYRVENATTVKYINQVIELLPNYECIQEVEPIDKDKFDLSWRPDPREPAYIYVWGNKFYRPEEKPTLIYHTPGATDYKYMDIVALQPEWDRWVEVQKVDRSNFDFSWRPDPRLHEPPYIYVWGNKYIPGEIKPTLEYHCPGATERKYMGNVDVLPEYNKWKILISVDKTSFDFSWRPDPREPAFIYVFGNKWNDAATEPTIEYHCPGAKEYKYINDVVAVPVADMVNWKVSNKEDLDTFDFSWRPNPHSPPQIYQWENDGPRYTVPGATEVVLMERTNKNQKQKVAQYFIKTTIEDLIKEHPEEVFWALNPDLNYDKFDFTWKPNETNFRHINVFGNEFSKNTQTYYINGPLYNLGYKEFNYIEDQSIQIDSSTLDMFFVDRYNDQSQERYLKLKEKYPQIQKTRYLNSWVDTINRCLTKATTKFFWVLSSELDYSEFVFDFYPSPWQEKMIHVFGTQWSHWGNTYMINKDTFAQDTKYVKVIEHLSSLNFVKSKKAKATDVLYDTIYIDHGNMNDIEGKTIIPYTGNYLTTFKHMLELLPTKKEHFVWICSSICDYNNFDFTYICDPFAKEQLHVFPSDNQKFGDTFLVNVNKLRELIDNMTMLEDYNKVNFNQHQKVKRLPAPVFVTGETHTSYLRDDYNFPYAVYITSDNEKLSKSKDNEPISLWDNNKDILVTSTGGSRIVVPKEAKSYVKTELYDYPYIKSNEILSESKPLDIIFFSNGEVGADENYEHLLFLTAGLGNRVTRVDGIQGRVASQHAAAKISETPWYFLVNAKLRVNNKFDFNWQPDRLQIPKHYIFTATNPVNGLEYGHQAIVANNKTLTLNTIVKGLDFTMDSEHEVVNVNSGVGMFNTSPWDTWRTAFREVIKLRNSDSLENKQRLEAWLNIGNGNFSQYSLQGAKDAIDYYESVNGDFEKLKLSYDWPWLKSYFDSKYK